MSVDSPSKPKVTLSINDRVLTAEDGTRIAYRVEGTGPALVLTNGLTTTTTFWKYVRPVWLKQHTVMTWDLPGHGNSGPAMSPRSANVYGQPRLIAALMSEVGIERAVQIGWSTGAQIALEMYRQFPAQCESIAMVLGGAGHVLRNTRLPVPGTVIHRMTRAVPPVVFSAAVRALMIGANTSLAVTLARKVGLIGERVSHEDAREIPAHVATVHRRTLQRLLISAETHSAHAVLPSLKVPLLIVAGDRDPFAPTERVGLELMQVADGAQLLRLPNGTHTALLEDHALIGERIEQFVSGR